MTMQDGFSGSADIMSDDLHGRMSDASESEELTESQKRELDKRLNDFHQNPHDGTPWEILKARLLKNDNQRNDQGKD